jgi:hypothetical protein
MYQRIQSNVKGCVQKPSDFESIWTFSEQIYSLFAELWNSHVMRFGVLIALNVKPAVSRDVMLCGLLNDNQHLRGTWCLHLQDRAVLVWLIFLNFVTMANCSEYYMEISKFLWHLSFEISTSCKQIFNTFSDFLLVLCWWLLEYTQSSNGKPCDIYYQNFHFFQNVNLVI